MNNYTYGQDGLHLTENAEGLRLKAYPDPATGSEPWTIGYGHTGADVYEGLEITQEQAELLLKADIQHASNVVNELVKVPLTQHQFDALVDFTFNCGAENFRKSTLLRCLNAGDYSGASEQFNLWVRGGGHILLGLVTRRQAETDLFQS